MRAPFRRAAFAACALACAGPDRERVRPADPDLRIWVPILVRWEAGQPRHVDFAIENPTNRTIAIAAPAPAGARVDVLSGPESVRVCGVAPAERAAAGERVALAPGDRVSVRVDLEAACRALPPGEYRYEVSYRAAEVAGTGGFSGTLPVRYGQVIVAPPSGSGSAASSADAADPLRPVREGRRPR